MYTPSQSWTTLRALQNSQDPKYKNIFTPDTIHGESLISIHTEPKQAIGQRAYLCRTFSPGNSRLFNVLWDCITYIDDYTITRINELGGIDAIVISHPHYYTTHLVWAEIFDCPVYLSSEDEEWAVVKGDKQVFFGESSLSFAPSGNYGGDDGRADIIVLKTGGHFPGSTVLWWRPLKTLLIADTIAVVPSGRYWVDRPAGTASFTFMWSYPNMVCFLNDTEWALANLIDSTIC
jgi:glyoxylase-like metal-dependent hydrolase (beta-lactamase superfamily II)